jgi:hypothetical protein
MPDPNLNVYGPMKHSGMVEDAMIDFLREWLPTYLAEINRRVEITDGVIPKPKSFMTVNEFGGWPEAQLPSILIMAPGLGGPAPIQKNGDGSYDLAYLCGVGGVVETASQRSSLRLAKLYMAAVRNLVMQNSSLGGRVKESWFQDEDSAKVPNQENRTLAGFEVVFVVALANVVSERHGPATTEPAVDPTVDPGQWPEIETADVVVTDKEDDLP